MAIGLHTPDNGWPDPPTENEKRIRVLELRIYSQKATIKKLLKRLEHLEKEIKDG